MAKVGLTAVRVQRASYSWMLEIKECLRAEPGYASGLSKYLVVAREEMYISALPALRLVNEQMLGGNVVLSSERHRHFLLHFKYRTNPLDFCHA
jgi:hypothetical protein